MYGVFTSNDYTYKHCTSYLSYICMYVYTNLNNRSKQYWTNFSCLVEKDIRIGLGAIIVNTSLQKCKGYFNPASVCSVASVQRYLH